MTLTEGRHATQAILYEERNSRANLRIGASAAVLACMLLGAVASGDAGGGVQTVGALTAFAGNTGNGVPGAAFTADAHAPAGRYQLVCIEPAANAGKFAVYKPDGTLDGVLTVAVAYNGTINGTLGDGAADFISGDGFYIDVSYADHANAGKLFPWDPDATNGVQTPVAMALYAATTGVGETADIACLVWNADINHNLIVWPDGVDDNDKRAAYDALAAVRTTIRDIDGNLLTTGRLSAR